MTTVVETAVGLLAKTATGPILDAAKRNERVVAILKQLRLDPKVPPSDFPGLYAWTLVEYCYGKSPAVLAFFRDQYVREAFYRSFSRSEWGPMDREIEAVLHRNTETGEFGHIGSWIRADVDGFMSAFRELVNRSRPAYAIQLENKLDALQALSTQPERPSSAPITHTLDPRFTPDPGKEVAVLEGAGWVRSLRNIYPSYELVRFGGVEFPIWAELAHEDEWSKPGLNVPLGDIDETVEPSFHQYNVGFDRAGRPQGRDFDPEGGDEYQDLHRTALERSKHNGPAYAFSRLDRVGGRLRISAAPGSYFDSVATSEMLEREFIFAQAENPDEPISLDRLPRRRWLHSRVSGTDEGPGYGENVVLDGRFRAAALSVATTVMFAEADGTYSALVVPRSNDVLTHPGFVHVAPSGILAPIDRNWHHWRREFSVERTVFREYAEELFGYEDLEKVDEGHSGAGLMQVPPVRRLRQAIKDGVVGAFYCGISVPLLTLRPEVCVLLLIRDPDWFDDERGRAKWDDKKPFKLNWEYAPGAGRNGLKLDLDGNFEPKDPDGIVRPTKMVPHAAAALALSTRVARQLASYGNRSQ